MAAKDFSNVPIARDNGRRRSSMLSIDRNERRVLVIYTGGTIGMMNTDDGLSPKKNVFKPSIRRYPQLHDDTYEHTTKCPGCERSHSFFVLPKSQIKIAKHYLETKDVPWRILYDIEEYDPLLDSSDMTEVQWIKIAENIKKYYAKYDGFVVLHGTDTLCYTASALSFMFENIGKAVVLTGSQIPIFEPRSDGVDNFVSSLIIAGACNIPEVTIFFGSKLLRGNRTRKLSVNNLYAFDSPNAEPIVKMGLDMEVNKSAIFKPSVIEKFEVHARMSKNVALLRMFPSISTEAIRASCQPPVDGLVIETYGAGNIPSDRPDIIDVVDTAVKRGVIIINITQCSTGSVAALYKCGQAMAKAGVVPGFDMTPEAALTKLSYVLTKTELSYQQKVEMMEQNIRGELTNMSSICIEDPTFKAALSTSLNIQSPKKLDEVTANVLSSLLLYGIKNGDMDFVKKLLGMGADVNAEDIEGKTPLHEAILLGDVHTVEYLLKNGANVHLRTKIGESPLITAVYQNDPNIIRILQKCGAHFASADNRLLEEIVTAAVRDGMTTKLEFLQLAGASLEMTDELRQTPLHKAVLYDCPEVVTYLVKLGVNKNCKDVLGYTPLDYATQLNRHTFISILN